jgi:nitrite reductase/ring-hydroxylating ferredoxin subunit
MTWAYVMDETALPEGSMAPVYPLGINVVIARVDGIVYAVSGKCAHMACPLITGTLRGHTLTCSCHDWRFDIRTGRLPRCRRAWSRGLPRKVRGSLTAIAILHNFGDELYGSEPDGCARFSTRIHGSLRTTLNNPIAALVRE